MPSEKTKEYNTRDTEGRVKTAPRKIYTNNSKKGNGCSKKGQLFGQYEYVSDPYDRLKEKDVKEQIDHRKKFLTHRPFKNNSSSIKFFDKERVTYANGARESPPRHHRPSTSIHAQAFKPSFPARQGYQKTFSHHEYIEENCFKGKKEGRRSSVHPPWKYNQLDQASYLHADMKTMKFTNVAALQSIHP